MKQYKMNLDDAIKHYNKKHKKKLTITEVARLANTNRITLNEYKNGNIPKFFDIYLKISDITGYPVEKLIETI